CLLVLVFSLLFVFFFFFFQAEDGIRDLIVTGVQTCALPISAGSSRAPTKRPTAGPSGPRRGRSPTNGSSSTTTWRARTARWPRRSEERRVGKECRSRWAADD